MKQGRYDLQASKISEMMKSNSLDVVLPLPHLYFPWIWFILYYNVLWLMFDAECTNAVTSKRREWDSR